MLGKLIKHEFRATTRVMLPLFAALLLSAAAANLAVRNLNTELSRILSILNTFVIVIFAVLMISAGVMSIVVMVSRFHKNLLTGEGYLMFTLPVTTHGLIWSKIIVSTIWFALCCVAMLLAGVVMALDVHWIKSVFTELPGFLKEVFSAVPAGHAALYILELLLLFFVYAAGVCLTFYAPCSIGYSFSRRKGLMSVLSFLLLQFIVNYIGIASLVRIDQMPWSFLDNIENMFVVGELVLLLMIGAQALYCALTYFITWYFLEKRLNLE